MQASLQHFKNNILVLFMVTVLCGRAFKLLEIIFLPPLFLNRNHFRRQKEQDQANKIIYQG